MYKSKLKFLVMAAMLAVSSMAAAEVTTVSTPPPGTVLHKEVRTAAHAAEFRAITACPATGKIQRWCPGYVVDHIEPLCAGGHDAPSNMQWQTKAASYKKDALERSVCSKLSHQQVHKLQPPSAP